MKLRIEKNSIRLRLRPSDMAQFTRTGRVDEIVDLGGSELGYGLASSEDARSPRAGWSEGKLLVTVPSSVVRHWAETDEVAIAAEQGPLSILIEKDFQCMHKDDAANRDAFPNPLAAA